MNAGTLTDRAQQLYNEETGNFLTDTLALSLLNYSKAEVEKETLCLPKSSTSNLTADTAYVIVPAGMFAIEQGGVQTTVYTPLPGPLSLAELQARGTGWKTDTGTATDWYFYYDVVTVSEVTNWAIGFYPIPDTTVSNGVTIFGYSTSAAWTGDSDTPAWPTPYHEVLAWGACKQAAIRDIERGQAVPEHALAFFSREYERQKGELRDALATMMGSKVYQRGQGQIDDDRLLARVDLTVS